MGTQAKMNWSATLFPDKAALVPFSAIAGDEAGGAPTITNFDAITKSNAFVLNDASSDTDLLVSEDGISLTYGKTGDSIQGFDEGGLGDIDDVTLERQLTMEIGVNGFSHDILAILLGLDPKTDINDHLKFNKSDEIGVEAAGLDMKGNIKKEHFLFIARVPLDQTGKGDLYFCAPKVVVQDQDIQVPMQNQKVTYTIPMKGLKLVNSAQLANLQTFSEGIKNGYEMMFFWNAGDTAYSDV